LEVGVQAGVGWECVSRAFLVEDAVGNIGSSRVYCNFPFESILAFNASDFGIDDTPIFAVV
jgi:hypothetical protein